MADVEVVGRIVAEDDFSAVLDKLVVESESAGQALDQLDEHIDAASAKRRLQEIEAELAELQAKAAKGIPLSVGEVERGRDLRREADRIRAGLEELGEGAEEAKTGVMGLLSGLGELQMAMTGLMGAFAAQQLISFTMELIRAGAQAQLVGQIFENVARQAGISGDLLITEMSEAARGTIDQTRLMIIANRALLAGGAELASKLPRLLEIARAASLATGQDINFVFDTLVRGIVKASPLLIDNADIYIKIGDAVERWAEKQGKTVDLLSETERRVAIANAVLEQGARFIEQMGLASETAADRIQSLPAAIEDLRSALGELALMTGIAEGISEVAENIRSMAEGINRFQDAVGVMADLGAELSGLGEASEELQTGFERWVSLAIGLTQFGTIGVFKWLLEMPPLAERADDILRKFDLTLQRLREDVPSADMNAWNRIIEENSRLAAEAAERQQIWNQAFTEARQEGGAASQVISALGQLAGQLSVAVSELPEMPRITGPGILVDTSALREYLEALRELRPELSEQIDWTYEYVEAIEQKQIALLDAANASEDAAEALGLLATETLGASSSALDLLRNYEQLPPVLRAAVDELTDIATVIRLVRQETEGPITVDMTVRGVEAEVRRIDSMMLRLAGILSPERIRELRDQALREYEAYFRDQGDLTEFEFELLQAQFLQGWDDIIQGVRRKYDELRRASERGGRGMFESASQLQSAITSALRMGVEVTPADMLATEAGTYQDKALEAARQLQAIVERGFAELEAHPDWAALLKIPPEVLSGSEAQLKAWAAQTKQDVLDLARPDLINWDAFIENFRRLQEKAAAQELTIDIAVEKLEAAGLLTGSEEEKRRQVAQALGLAEPSITLEALFTVPEGSAEAIINQILAGQTALPIPVIPQVTTPETTATAVEATPGVAREAALEGGVPVEVETAPAEVQAQGSDLAAALFSGFESVIVSQDAGGMVASAWADDFTAHQEDFANIGRDLGNTIMDALLEALSDGASRARDVIARAVAPEVASILQEQQGGRSALP
ncbi:MAG TPA: hypothetical protein G4O02_13315 [Caldilineae bacterium]|nr:hypothetical protein [Caldilineae bacterium]